MADSTESVQPQANQPLGAEALPILQHIEKMMEDQAEHNRKMLRSSRWRTVFVAIFVAAFIVIGVVLYNALQTIVADIPEVVSKANELIENANGAVETAQDAVRRIVAKINEIDIDALNESIDGIASIDYKGLNTSIGGLADTVESFRNFVDALSTPATALGSLFG